jgi:hypothetical protein
VVFFTFLIGLLWVTTCSAAQRARFIFPRGRWELSPSIRWQHFPYSVEIRLHPAPAPAVLPYSPEYYRNVEPKFYGGFHYHQLHNVGIPPGDIGFYGNGIITTPW